MGEFRVPTPAERAANRAKSDINLENTGVGGGGPSVIEAVNSTYYGALPSVSRIGTRDTSTQGSSKK